MNATETINKIKEMFGIKTEQKFAEVMTIDGSKLQIEPELIIDAAVLLILEDGTPTVANGEYTLEDGTIITVEDGVLKVITIPTEEPETAVEVEQPLAEEMQSDTDEQKVKKLVESIVKEHYYSKDEVEEMFNAQANLMKTEFSKLNENILSSFELFAKQENSAPTEKPKEKFKIEKKQSWVNTFLGQDK